MMFRCCVALAVLLAVASGPLAHAQEIVAEEDGQLTLKTPADILLSTMGGTKEALVSDLLTRLMAAESRLSALEGLISKNGNVVSINAPENVMFNLGADSVSLSTMVDGAISRDDKIDILDSFRTSVQGASCADGKVVSSFTGVGVPECTRVLAPGDACDNGKALVGLDASGSAQCTGQLVTGGTCSNDGDFIKGFSASGVDCEAAVLLDQGCPAGKAVSGFDGNGALTCTDNLVPVAECPAGQVVTAVTSTGVDCADDKDTFLDGFGNACPDGQFITGFSAAGELQCGADFFLPDIDQDCPATRPVSLVDVFGVVAPTCCSKTGVSGIHARAYKLQGCNGCDAFLSDVNEARRIADVVTGVGIITVADGTRYDIAVYVDDLIIDRVDLNGGEFQHNGEAFLNYPAGIEGEDFVYEVDMHVNIPAGTWTIGVGSDDGRYLTMDAIVFDTVRHQNNLDDGGIGTNKMGFQGTTGHEWSTGTFTVTENTGCVHINSLFFERGGGDSYEIVIAPGDQDSEPSDNGVWRILREGTYSWKIL
eukprot:m.479738 g.479738  ORF g.479738 m.479738 type:complete len:537 (-) comp21581_c0_seq1:193-1803(-)